MENRLGHWADCGDGLFAIGCSFTQCETRKVPRIAHVSCGRLVCPVCHLAVASRSAGDIEDRVLGMGTAFECAGHEMGGVNLNVGELKHLALSPHQDRNGTVWLGPLKDVNGRDVRSRRKKWTKDAVIRDGGRKLMRECRKVLADFAKDGFYAGVVVLHLERKKHFGPVRDHQDDSGRWVRCYDSDCELLHTCYDDWTSCEDDDCELVHRWFWGPHVHFDGYVFLERSDIFHEWTGWQYTNIEDEWGRNIFLTARYQLTHSAHFERIDEDGKVHRRQHYSYVGRFANRFGGLFVSRKKREPEMCEKCQSPVREYGLKPDSEVPDYTEDRGPHEVETMEGIYYVRLDGQIYPRILRDLVRSDAEHRKALVDFKAEYKRPVWAHDGLILGDGRILTGFNNPAVALSIYHRVEHRRRLKYHPRNVINYVE